MKKRFTKRATATALTAILAAAALAGCGSDENSASNSAESSTPTSETQQNIEASDSAGGAEDNETAEKPYEGVTLTWWTKSNGNVTANYSNLSETPWAQYVMEQTGITIEFIHPTDADAEFTLMMADGEYPDIIEHTWTKYDGGPQAAIDDEVILNLDDIFANQAPNMKSLLEEHPNIERMIKTSSGHYYCFPFLRGLEDPNMTQFSSGFLLRKDVLDELKLEMPSTIDEWDTVLRAFKEYGFEKPFVTRNEWMKDVWSPGFDNWGDFYVEDGVVKNGLIEDSRKELITKLNEWYTDKLISGDWLNEKKDENQTDFTTEKAAACYAPFGQGLGNYTQIMNSTDVKNAAGSVITQEDIRSTVPVTSEAGKNAKFSKMNQIYDGSGVSAAITTNCSNVDAAVWLLDWIYSEEGDLACNFGIEGESYEMVNGEPVYTDLILHNEKPVAEQLAAYTRASTSGVCVQSPSYIEQYYEQENQKEALQLSMSTDMGLHFFPPTSVSEENSERYADIMSNVKTRVSEMEAAFINGTESLDNWDSYIESLKSFGIEEAIQMMQEAYDAYMAN